MKIIIRILGFPFVLGLIFLSYNIRAFKRAIDFLRYGGEWINYDKNERITIQKIYEELRVQTND